MVDSHSSEDSPASEGAADSEAPSLSHLDDAGHAHMVDVGDKDVTTREARARAEVRMLPATLALLLSGEAPKGDVLATARIAGIQAAKKTSDLIPLCHPLPLTGCKVELGPLDGTRPGPDGDEAGLEITTWVRCSHRTGVEMEALTAASVAALTIYDMLKAVDRGMRIVEVALLEKRGGRSGDWSRNGR